MLKMHEVSQWIITLIYNNKSPYDIKDFESFACWLVDGVVLCLIIQHIRPELITKISGYDPKSSDLGHRPVSKMRNFRSIENVLRFIASCQTLGVSKQDIFDTPDLLESRNIPKVIDCLHVLYKLHPAANLQKSTEDANTSAPSRKSKILSKISPDLYKKLFTVENIRKCVHNMLESEITRERDEEDEEEDAKDAIRAQAPILPSIVVPEESHREEEGESNDAGVYQYESLADAIEECTSSLENDLGGDFGDLSSGSGEGLLVELERLKENERRELVESGLQDVDVEPIDFDESTVSELLSMLDGIDAGDMTTLDDDFDSLPAIDSDFSIDTDFSIDGDAFPEVASDLSISEDVFPASDSSLSLDGVGSCLLDGFDHQPEAVPEEKKTADKKPDPSMQNFMDFLYNPAKEKSKVASPNPAKKGTAKKSKSTEPVSSPSIMKKKTGSAAGGVQESPTSPPKNVQFKNETESPSAFKKKMFVAPPTQRVKGKVKSYAHVNLKKNMKRREGFTADMIIPGLYLGDRKASLNFAGMQERNINSVVTLIGEKPFESKLNYCFIDIEDSVSAKISVHFKQINEFIDKVIENGDSCIVHCQKGVSRSAAVTIAYIMYSKNMSFYDAADLVCEKRSVVCPNLGFIEQLKEYEEELEAERKQQSA
eukprot:TRINITY_DN12893_c0_g1_i1.p1 TRINITY_DN12893_c0_g1~~TRINITY_DN12893_c0_g1_i1.p1  ORF type:complete len:719 (+),score=233.26 TRINITY_DN12893_c0_g1_i1:192-2159(+)